MRLVAVDLDGSFIRTGGSEVSDHVQSLQHGLYRRRGSREGVALVYATGRPLTWVRGLLSRLDLSLPRHTPLVLYNGSVVAEAGTSNIIARRTISARVARSVVARALSEGAVPFAYTGPHDLPFGDELETVVGWRASGPRATTDANGIRIRWAADADSAPECVAILVEATRQGAPALAQAIDDVGGISVTTSGAGYLEVRPEGSDKAAGLSDVTERLHIARQQVLALGDSDNDIEMLDWAGIAVSVAGSSQVALEHSDFVSRYGAADAAIEVLRLIKHARRLFPNTDRAS